MFANIAKNLIRNQKKIFWQNKDREHEKNSLCGMKKVHSAGHLKTMEKPRKKKLYLLMIRLWNKCFIMIHRIAQVLEILFTLRVVINHSNMATFPYGIRIRLGSTNK